MSKVHYRNFCSRHMPLLFEKINREAPFAGLLGVSSNNGFPRINKARRGADGIRKAGGKPPAST